MFQAFLFSVILSLDAFTSSIAYGISKIKIPVISAIIISIVGTFFLGFSFLVSYFLKEWINPQVCSIISFGLLSILGLHNLFCAAIKRYLKNREKNHPISFSLSNIKIMMNIYVDETNADLDHSKILSHKEALFLAIALSIDSLATGFSMGLGDIPYLLFLIFTFVISILSIFVGAWLGKKVSNKIDLSWLSGLVLLILGILKLL